jgi:hypothetical protein
MRQFWRFDAHNAGNNPQFNAIFAKNSRIRNAGVTGSSPVSGTTFFITLPQENIGS